MNLTLKKYELMKELGITTDIEYRDNIWVMDDGVSLGQITNNVAAAILERICREWLEKEQSIYINADDQGFYYAFYMQHSTDPITGLECEYPAAQIAALEECLEKRQT